MNRRAFLQTGAALVIAVHLPRAASASKKAAALDLEPNAWVRIGADGRVTVFVSKSEMGQGVMTGLPMLVAEELDVALASVRVEFAPADPKYAGPGMPFQLTGGSSSTRSLYEPLRKAGAQARALLVAAAAKTWSTAPDKLTTKNGVVHAPNGKELPYGKLVALAATLPVPLPADVPLKDPKAFQVIGTRAPRLDIPSKVDGSAVFGIDVKLPGLLVAVVERCPVFGGRLKSVDASAAKAIPGVRGVYEIATGVAVVGDGYWPATQGRRALKLTWDEGAHAALSSASIATRYAAAGKQPGVKVRSDGDASALERGAKKLDAVYQLPYLAHSPMEPLNCTVQLSPGGCDVWVPTQAQTFSQQAAAQITGLKPAQVRIHTTLLGGGFGRRGEVDFVAEAVQIAMAAKAPVKLIWSREDEIQHGFYRPTEWTRIEASLDKDGWPVSWRQRIVSASIFSRVFPAMVKEGIDKTSVDGSGADLPYAVPNIHVDWVHEETGVPVGFWRSVGHSSNAFATESFVDELAAASGKDPLEFRRHLLGKSPRHLAVLERAAKEAGWGKPLAKGLSRGLAVHASFGSFVAQVAEISIDADHAVRVHRVVCAIDCGKVVCPDGIEAQMQGGIVYGLTAALKGAITLANGRVQQSNFHDYPMLRMNEMPRVEVHLVASDEPLGGVGEPGVPPIAPAVANAIFAATRKRLRTLPIETALKA